jgi:hypothetical protein
MVWVDFHLEARHLIIVAQRLGQSEDGVIRGPCPCVELVLYVVQPEFFVGQRLQQDVVVQRIVQR